MDNDRNLYLAHHGVLGQRWGVKRSQSTSSVPKKKQSKAAIKQEQKESVKAMSDAELRQRLNRIQMEKQYAQLNRRDVSAGQKFISDVFMNAAKQTATNYVSKYLTKGVDTAIGSLTKNK